MAGLAGFIAGILFTGAMQRHEPLVIATTFVAVAFTILFQVYRK